MKFMHKYIQKYWKSFSAAVLFLTIEAVSDLMQPLILAKIIDIGVANKDMNYVLEMGGFMLLITAIGAIAASTRNVISSYVSQKFGSELRADLFKKTQSLSLENIDKFDRASLVTRLTNDVTHVQTFVNGLMRVFVKAPLVCIGSIIMVVYLNVSLSIILAVVVPIVGILIVANMKISFPYFLKVQYALDRVNSVLREYLSGVRVVKAFNRFDFEKEKFNKTNEELQFRSTSAMRVLAIFRPGIMLAMNFGIVAVLWIGGLGVENGQIQVGVIIAFISYMSQILFALMLTFMIFNMFIRARASAERINEVFSQEDKMKWSGGKEPISHARIDFENVSFSYEGPTGEPVLKNVSLSCLPGDTVGIIGSTGAGKSSLVNLIPRFYDPTAGVVKIGGVDIKQIDSKKLREKIAVVPQNIILFTGTILNNIKWGKEAATLDEVERAAKMAEAHDFVTAFPEGYQTWLGQGGVNLSGGQKQRVSIARALVRNPEILILDDCTSAVDVATEAKIKKALKKYANHLTCLIIAQRITSVIDADKIIVMDNGEIVGIGTHEELMKDCNIYHEIYHSQMGKGVEDDVTTSTRI